MFYKTNSPRSYRRPYFTGARKKQIILPPPSQSNDYFAWEFDGDLNEYNGTPEATLTGSGTYFTGKVGQMIQNPNLLIQNSWVKDNLFLTFEMDFAISFWNRSGSGGQIRISVFENGTNGRLWGFWSVLGSSALRFHIGNSSVSRSVNNGFDLCWIIHDTTLDNPPTLDAPPTYTLTIGTNDDGGIQYTTTNTIAAPASPSDPTFQVTDFNLGRLDQLVIWKSRKTPADMAALYNDNKGIPLSELS